MVKTIKLVMILWASLYTTVVHADKPYHAVGTASFYGYESGSRTASGEKFKPLGISAAHRTLPLGSKVKVTNLKNGKSSIIKINDRGPYIKGRILDLSLGAAKSLGISGLQKVEILAIR